MRILITGGAGFIGSALVRRTVAEGHDVLNVDKLTYAGRPETVASVADRPNYTFLKACVTDGALLAKVVPDFKPDAIIHLAAETHVDRAIDSPAEFIETNIRGTYVMLEAALQHVSRLEAPARAKFRYIQVSTDEVYGTLGDVGAFDEQSPYKPNSPYSACKAAGDHLAWAWFATYQLPVVISNCSNNYGPYQHPEKLIPTVIRNALVDAPIPVYGDGRNRRDWLHVDDHVDGLLKAVAAGRPGDKFGFGGGGDIANIDLVQRICRILDRLRPRPDGRSRDSQIRFVDDRPGHDFRYAIDCRKAQKELGWRPRRNIDEGLEETVAWYLGNSDWLVRPSEELTRLGLGRMARA